LSFMSIPFTWINLAVFFLYPSEALQVV
jgi:hypothetical protein